MEEEWRDVIGFGGKYKISNFGNVISIDGKYKGARLLSPGLDFVGYRVTTLRNYGQKRQERIHRLVAETFIPNPENKPQVNHKDGNKANNHVDNLEWVTGLENIRHAIKTGLINANGEKSANSKLTKEEVLKIRHLAIQGVKHSQIESMLNFKVRRRHITDIVNRVNWRHI